MIHLYTTNYCGYCSAARRLLARHGYAYAETDLSGDYGLRERVSRRAGNYRMVPMIFIGDEFIGGYDELAALQRSGQLAVKLGRAPAP